MLKLTNFVTRPIAAAAAIALLGLTLGSAHAALVPFSEDFNTGSAPDFNFSGAGFSVGATTMDFGGVGNGVSGGAVVDLTNANGVPIIMSTTFSASVFGSGSDIGLWAFSGTTILNTTGYQADVKANGSMRIVQRPSTTLVSAPAGTFSFDTNETYTLTLSAVPNGGQLDLTLTIDDPSEGGPLSIMGTSSVLYSGIRHGYRSRNNGGLEASFDDFSVNIIPEPSSMALFALGLVGMVSLRKRNRC